MLFLLAALVAACSGASIYDDVCAPQELDYCGFCTAPGVLPKECDCTATLRANRACLPCDLNSSAINQGLRLCVPNDAGVTGLPGPYMVFDIEITLVRETFATIPGVTYPGRVDANGVLLNCFCEPIQCACFNPGDVLDVCGLCSPPAMAGANCTCTPALAAAGVCVVCPAQSSASSDATRLCHPVVPGVYEPIDIARCDVREQFLTYPGTVYPGFFGVNAAGQPLALDCFCQPPLTTVSTTRSTATTTTLSSTTSSTTTVPSTPPATTTAPASTTIFPTTTPSSYCLNVTLPCDGSAQGGASVRADTNGVYCVPTQNSTLFLRIGCNSFGTGFDAWSCPFGCDNVCQEDPAISTSLNLGAYLGRLSGPGFCASGDLFPLLPVPAQMRCVPGSCITRTIAVSTTTTTTLQTTTPQSTTATTTVPSTTTAVVVTTSTGSSTTLDNATTTTLASTSQGSTPTATSTSTASATTTPVTPSSLGCLSVKPGCAPPGQELSNLTTGVYCSLISLPSQQYSLRLTCVLSGGLQVELCDVTDCSRNCTSSPVILALLGLQNTDTREPGVCATTSAAIPGVGTADAFLTCYPSCVFTTTTAATLTTTTSTAAPTTTTTLATTAPPLSMPPTNQVPPVLVIANQQQPSVNRVPLANDETDLLAIIGVPTAVLAATILLFTAQRERPAVPQYYPQGI